jgi:hypothetical protein
MTGCQSNTEPLYGPYHRIRSPTQDEDTARKQVYEGRLLGRPARWSFFPSVKAYHGHLPPDVDGIEFVTTIMPTRATHPSLVFWDAGATSVPVITLFGIDFAVVKVRITRFVYSP